MITSTSVSLGAGLSASTATFCLAQATDSGPSPWWLAIIGAMGGFVALIVKWLMSRQDAMHAANAARDAENRKEAAAREERLQKRADDHSAMSQTQTLVLQSIAQGLGKLDEHARATREAIDEVPERVVDELNKRRTG